MKESIISFIKRYKFSLGIIVFFVIYMLFVDEYNLIRIRKDSKKLQTLKTEKAYLLKKIEKDRQQLQTLETDTDALEKFAREEYLMKKENEEVFVIQEKN